MPALSSQTVLFSCLVVCLVGASLLAQRLKRLPAMQETWV